MAQPDMIEPADETRRPRSFAQVALVVLASGVVLGGLIALGVRYHRDR